jgi:hypothetical protein
MYYSILIEMWIMTCASGGLHVTDDDDDDDIQEIEFWCTAYYCLCVS